MKFQRRRRNMARYFKGKARKHHWFKSGMVLIRMMLDGKRSELERKRIEDAKRGVMYSSVHDLFKKD